MIHALVPAIGQSMASYGANVIERLIAVIAEASTLWEWTATIVALWTLWIAPIVVWVLVYNLLYAPFAALSKSRKAAKEWKDKWEFEKVQQKKEEEDWLREEEEEKEWELKCYEISTAWWDKLRNTQMGLKNYRATLLLNILLCFLLGLSGRRRHAHALPCSVKNGIGKSGKVLTILSKV